VWLYHRFPLSFREVEELMLERGVIVSYETIRRWCMQFGQHYANSLRHRQPQPGDKRHLDEVFSRYTGVQRYLWRAVDQDGKVLDILVQNRRDKTAARRFFRRLLKKARTVPRVVSRTSSAPTVPLTARSYPRSSTAPTRASTTGRRTATSQPGGVNVQRRASAPLEGRSGSCPRSAVSHRTSGPAAI
jgi:putative transposase